MPARKPTSLKIASGTLRKSRTKNEPIPPAALPVAPAWLTTDALVLWNEFAPICHSMGTLSMADVNSLARWCELMIQWRQCQAVIAAQGMTFNVLTDEGAVKYIAQRPEVGIANRLAVQLRALEGDLGLNAVARGRIDVPADKRPGAKTKSSDPKERFFA